MNAAQRRTAKRYPKKLAFKAANKEKLNTKPVESKQ